MWGRGAPARVWAHAHTQHLPTRGEQSWLLLRAECRAWQPMPLRTHDVHQPSGSHREPCVIDRVCGRCMPIRTMHCRNQGTKQTHTMRSYDIFCKEHLNFLMTSLQWHNTISISIS